MNFPDKTCEWCDEAAVARAKKWGDPHAGQYAGTIWVYACEVHRGNLGGSVSSRVIRRPPRVEKTDRLFDVRRYG